MFVQFHCLRLYQNDLYRNDRFLREVMRESHAKGDASLAIIAELARGLHSLVLTVSQTNFAGILPLNHVMHQNNLPKCRHDLEHFQLSF